MIRRNPGWNLKIDPQALSRLGDLENSLNLNVSKGCLDLQPLFGSRQAGKDRLLGLGKGVIANKMSTKQVMPRLPGSRPFDEGFLACRPAEGTQVAREFDGSPSFLACNRRIARENELASLDRSALRVKFVLSFVHRCNHL